MKKINLLLCIIALTVIFSCVDENEKLGLSLVRENSAVNVLRDSSTGISMESKIFKTDTLLTNGFRYNAVGSYYDANFGRISSAVCTQVALTSSGKNFQSLGEGDSVVLSLKYDGAFTENTSVRGMMMHFKVEEITEELSKEKTHVNDNVEVSPNVLFEGDVKIDMDNDNTSFEGDTNTYLPHLRLKLSNEFLNRLQNSTFADNNSFMEEIKGLRISATNTDSKGMIIYFDLTAENSGLTYYYHTESGKNYNYKMTFPTETVRFMQVKYDYSNSRLSSLAASEEIDADEYMFLSCLGMAEIKLDIKEFDSWYNRDSVKGRIINKAELILPVADISGDKFTYPSSMQCYRKTSDGTIYLLRDETIASSLNAVPYYDSTINAYRVQITSFIQGYINKNYDDLTLYIVPSMRGRDNTDRGYNRRNSINRVVLNGVNYSNPDKRPKLNITYSNVGKN
ncbi:MAG: DUF4270 family protein [Bacteroidales bacterium]|nr:DUF4270 family protein [Bacteroidales bacterium]